ncbi:MAG: S8 family serine peptidase [Tissierellia bacterium]|nr:S8 family serine peptidase [Tissierellia bacterium]
MKNLIFVLTTVILLSLEAKSQNYYWYHNKKIFIEQVSNKRFILFESLNDTIRLKKSLDTINARIESFKKVNINVDLHKSTPIGNKYWTIVETDSSLSNNPLILYEAPFFLTSHSNEVGLSHLFYVKLKNHMDIDTLEKMAESNNVAVLGNNPFMPLWYTLACSKNSTGNALEMANIFYESNLFTASEPDFMTNYLPMCVNDSLFDMQWGLSNVMDNLIDINFCEARQITAGNTNIIVAVIDQGIELDHPDLTNICQISYDLESGSSPSQIYNYHGTSCAGIIGAGTNNTIGVAGIAPNCPLMSISDCMNDASINTAQELANGIIYASDMGASVLSNSWGHDGFQCSMMDDAIDEALSNGRNGLGCVLVFAAGNNVAFPICYPASLSSVLAVGAIDRYGYRAGISRYGASLNVVAPAVIPTTDLQGLDGDDPSDYTIFPGTSAACPHVSAVAALVLSVNPCLTQAEVKYIIEATCIKLPYYTFSTTPAHPNGTWNNEVGYGLVDAYQAVLEAIPIIGDNTIDLCDTKPYYFRPSDILNEPTLDFIWSVSKNLRIENGQGSSGIEVKSLGCGEAWIALSIVYKEDTLELLKKEILITSTYATMYLETVFENSDSFTSDVLISGTVTISSGCQIDIMDGVTIYCTPNAKIIVEPGGYLNLINATITSACEGEMWQGIELYGIDGSSPHDLSSHGFLYMTGSTIENAMCAVNAGGVRYVMIGSTEEVDPPTQGGYGQRVLFLPLNGGGGIIQAEYSNFINNKQSINYNSGMLYALSKVSMGFYKCTFTIDNNASFTVTNNTSQIFLSGVRGIHFNHCTFQNLQSTSGVGIYANGAGVDLNMDNVNGIIDPPCIFEGFGTAVYVTNAGTALTRIVNTEFSNNKVAVSAKGSNNMQIESCVFSVPTSTTVCCGVLLHNCNAYKIENNYFSGYNGTGLRVEGHVESNNYIKYNTFENLCVACDIQGIQADNSNLTYCEGLQFLCNIFDNNNQDLLINENSNIRRIQGSIFYAAGNQFGPTVSSMNIQNIGVERLVYYYNMGLSHHEPLYYAGCAINGIPMDMCIEYGYTGENYYLSGSLTLEELEDLYLEKYDEFTLLELEYLSNYNTTSIEWDFYIDSLLSYTGMDEVVFDPQQLDDYIEITEIKSELDMICKDAVAFLLKEEELNKSLFNVWLSRSKTKYTEYLLAESYMEDSDIILMDSILDNIPILYSDSFIEENNNYSVCLHYLASWRSIDPDYLIISQGAIDTLESISSGSDLASIMAESILERFGKDFDIPDPLVICWRIDNGSRSEETGMKESISESEQKINISPNPANDLLTLDNRQSIMKEVRIYDVIGKEIKRFTINDSKVIINISDLKAGIYLINIQTEQEIIKKKIIKSK